MSLLPNKKNGDIYICLIVLLLSAFIAAKTWLNIQSVKQSLAIDVPFTTDSNKAYYGFYNQKQQCFGYLDINKYLDIDIKSFLKGQVRLVIDNNPATLDFSAGFITNTLRQLSHSTFTIKQSDNELFSFVSNNANPIDVSVSVATRPVFTRSFPGPISFEKKSSKLYTLTLPPTSINSEQKKSLDFFKQNFANFIGGMKIIEHQELPPECLNNNGSSLNISEYFLNIQQLIKTQLSLSSQ